MSPPSDGLLFSRRGFVQTGYSAALGLSLAGAMPRRVDAGTVEKPRKTKSVVIVFLTGAASHIDTFDMKPDAPAEIRGQFQPIATSVPGLQICEHLPMLARRMDRCALG
jgi:uncharacterized protein (DUF1501 family)